MRPRTCVSVLAAALALSGCSDSTGKHEAVRSYRGATRVDPARIVFDDGDTFTADGQTIRVLGIDTPETRNPDVGIFDDQPYGVAAAESTRAWILRARVVEIATDGTDRYGRRLAHVFLDGELLALRLIEHGLAYENASHFGDNGFPDLADRIIAAAHARPRPPFQEPHKWRQKNQKPVENRR